MTKPKLQAKQDLVMAMVKMRGNSKYIEEENEKLVLAIDSEEVPHKSACTRDILTFY